MNEDKEKMLKLTTDQIESKFGKGSIMTLGEGGADLNIGVIPTGALPLDAALGIGGVPRGRIIEIYGPESSGKTTLALQILAEAQALGGIVAFIDAEHALDPGYAARIGRRYRRGAHLPARHRRAGAGDLRHARALGRYRLRRRRLCGRARPPCRNRGRDGRYHRGSSGSAHVPGPAQAGRVAVEIEHHLHLHQPAAREDRSHVRQPGDDHRRTRPEVLLLGSHRHSPHRLHQAERRCGRQSREGEGGQEQGGSSFPPGGVRSHVRRGHLSGRLHRRYGRGMRRGQEVRRLVHLRRGAPGPGPRGSQADAQGESRSAGGTREQGPRGLRDPRHRAPGRKRVVHAGAERAARRNSLSWRPRPTYSQRSGRISPPWKPPLPQRSRARKSPPGRALPRTTPSVAGIQGRLARRTSYIPLAGKSGRAL